MRMLPSSRGTPRRCSSERQRNSAASPSRENHAATFLGALEPPNNPVLPGNPTVTLAPSSSTRRAPRNSISRCPCALQRGQVGAQRQTRPAAANPPLPRQPVQRKRSQDEQERRRWSSPKTTPQFWHLVPSAGTSAAPEAAPPGRSPVPLA